MIDIVTEKQFETNSYCIREAGHAILIDPVLSPDFKQTISQDVIDFAIVTHEHYDHIRGLAELRAAYGVKCFCGRKAEKGLGDSSVNLSRYMDYLKKVIPFGDGSAQSCDYACEADEYLEDNQVIAWQGHDLLIRETPGHSAGSISILMDGRLLFSGDTIFKDYPTATRIPGGSTKAFQTITAPWLDSLPQDVCVYPGHTEPFRLSERYQK